MLCKLPRTVPGCASSFNLLKYSSLLLLSTAVHWQLCAVSAQSNVNNGNKAVSSSKRVPNVLEDLGRMIIENCPPMLCTGVDCVIVTERNQCQLCACPIGSPARGCDPMPFVLWHDLMVLGCPNATTGERRTVQKVHRWFRRVNGVRNTDECEPYIFPYCSELDYNLWRSPRTKAECEFYCYSFQELQSKGKV